MLTEHLKKLDLSASVNATIAGKKGLKVIGRSCRQSIH